VLRRATRLGSQESAAVSSDPTDPLKAERRANQVLAERVRDLERQLQRFGTGSAAPLGSALSEREALLSEAERIAHMGSWVWDVVSNEVQWSDELFRILGYDPTIDSASTDAFFARVHPQDRERVQRTSAQGIADGLSRRVDFQVRRPDGSTRHVSMDGALLFDADGKLQRAVGTVLDVTEAHESARRLERTAIVTVARRMLEKGGHRVRVAHDAKEAIDLFEQEPAELLVTDVVMPGMTGVELCAVLEQRAPLLRTLFITGYAPDHAELGPAPGRRAVVMKPFRADDLLLAVGKLLSATRS
jgi:PAS domain S-box-containing protein